MTGPSCFHILTCYGLSPCWPIPRVSISGGPPDLKEPRPSSLPPEDSTANAKAGTHKKRSIIRLNHMEGVFQMTWLPCGFLIHSHFSPHLLSSSTVGRSTDLGFGWINWMYTEVFQINWMRDQSLNASSPLLPLPHLPAHTHTSSPGQ